MQQIGGECAISNFMKQLFIYQILIINTSIAMLKKSRLTFVITLLSLCPSILFASGKDNAFPASVAREHPFTIVIDPGHGGLDPGTVGTHSAEKTVALAIALKLGKLIQDSLPDVKIVYTRTTDILPENAYDVNTGNRNRAKIANNAQGDLFISIHCNAAYNKVSKIVGHKTVYVKGRHGRKIKKREPVYRTYTYPSSASGTEVYVWKTEKNGQKKEVLKENSAMILDSSAEPGAGDMQANTPENTIMLSYVNRLYFDQSVSLMQKIEAQFDKAGRTNRGMKQRDVGIWVLQATAMPSVLVETGFLSNPEEEAYLNSESGQQQIAGCIFNAIRAYKEGLGPSRQATAG